MEKNPKKKNKKTLSMIFTLLTLFLIFYLLFRNNYKEIIQNIRSAKTNLLILILFVGFTFQFFEAVVCHTLVKRKNKDFTFAHALELTYLGVFTKVVTLSLGSLPMRALYLHRKGGIGVGEAAGLASMEYTLHKFSMLFWSGILLLFSGKELFKTRPNLIPYTVYGYAVGLAIVLVILLICTWNKFYNLIIKFVEKPKKNPKWEEKQERISRQITALHTEARSLFRSPETVLYVIGIDFLKLFLLYIIPYLSAKAMSVDTLPILLTMTLTSLILVVSGALPNVAGMGPIEAAFALLFSYYYSSGEMVSILVLYRFATYFFPFIISAVVVQRLSRYLSPDEPMEDLE